ncbi:phosphatidate cytidylyltransferase [Desulfobotulus sp. H1]|uniref:Phosphatidate cytidylyltransferase n=1 Tax=Desulfobotulus pelophilus TaxID=2823377 RepID=A0ABT3N5A9_9BACT|nr:phosphatidate cytidylyltransferase [Desulfobotulus pelophilus]MCW7752645.1 phosphatidate cytidylyltransferase [Desulfobotulus pelophilus]
MHGTRWLTAILALPVLVWLIAAGGPFFFFLLLLGVAFIAQSEYHRIVDARASGSSDSDLRWIARLAMALLVLLAFWGMTGVLAGLIVAFLILTGLCMACFRRRPDLLTALPLELQGLLWIGFPLACLGALRVSDHGVAWVFFTLFLVASGDTGAYYAGRFWGRNKLAPAISPAKTREGFVGGVVLTLVLAVLFKLLFLPSFALLPVLFTALLTSLVAPVGDLFESMQKRISAIKDSGRLLPGHGGMLDRIDALLFAAPVVFVMRTWLC